MRKEKINGEFQRYSRLLLTGFIVIFIFAGAEVVPSSVESNKEKIVPISFSTIDKGLQSGIKGRKFVVIKTDKEWEDFWRLHKRTFLPQQPIPHVDFKQEIVIAVFSGEKRTGGHGIEIKRVEQNLEKGQLEVFFLETHPSPGAMVIQGLTQPYDIVKLKKFDIPVVFIAVNLR